MALKLHSFAVRMTRLTDGVRTCLDRGSVARLLVAIVSLGLAVGCARRAPDQQLVALLPPAPTQAGPEYRIQAGDELNVRFPFQPDVSEQVPVRPDGRITLATTGEIDVAGLSTEELSRLVVERSSSKLRNPEVVIVVTKIAERKVYVGGEVNRPGYVVLESNMTPLQAVMATGGFKRTARLDSVLLLTPGPGGRFSAARMNMDQVVNDGVPERVRLHPGDIVFAPKTWIGQMDDDVDLYIRGLIPMLPRVGAGYSL